MPFLFTFRGKYLFFEEKSRTFVFGFATATFADGERDVAQSGSATVWGTGGRKFESCHPDTMKKQLDTSKHSCFFS